MARADRYEGGPTPSRNLTAGLDRRLDRHPIGRHLDRPPDQPEWRAGRRWPAEAHAHLRGDGRRRSGCPASGLERRDRRPVRMAVDQRAEDAAVDVAVERLVLGPWLPLGDHRAVAGIE